MNPFTLLTNEKPGRFRIGDRVRVAQGFGGAEGEVLEARGLSGHPIRHHYYLRLTMPYAEAFEIELPEECLEPIPSGNGQAIPSA
jgi:hypothetical protein